MDGWMDGYDGWMVDRQINRYKEINSMDLVPKIMEAEKCCDLPSICKLGTQEKSWWCNSSLKAGESG